MERLYEKFSFLTRLTSSRLPHRHYPVKKKKGTALATVLMVVVLAVIMGFSLAGTSICHLNVSSHEVNTLKAFNLADSVVAQCIEKVISDETYGMNADKTLKIHFSEAPDESYGTLTFDRTEATKLNIPYSTYNLDSHVAIQGWGNRAVPGSSVHLVGTGTCNGITRNVETIIYFPPFPYVIASSGKFNSSGKLLVAQLEDPGLLMENIDESTLLPGNIASNNPEVDAVSLMGEGKITGNVHSSGGVKLNPEGLMKILGEIRTNADPISIQKIDLREYDPIDKKGVQKLPEYMNSPTLEGLCRRAGNLIIAGDLRLKEALLYVDGSLQIGGSVDGKGAVVVTGETVIGRGAHIATDNLVALLSSSNVSIGGASGMDTSYFNGIVYTEGNFVANQITLVGCFISAGEKTSEISLNNVSLFEVTNPSVDFFAHTTFFMNMKGVFNGLASADRIDEFNNKISEMSNKPLEQREKWFLSDANKIIIACGNTGYSITTYELQDGNIVSVEKKYQNFNEMISDLYEYVLKTNQNPKSIEEFRMKVEQSIKIAFKQEGSSYTEPNPDEWVDVDIGPSKFFSRADRMRILLWKKM